MDQWIKDLWAKNKLVFLLLIPIILLAIFRNFVIDLLVRDGKRIANEAEAKDKTLLKEETEAKAKSDQLVEDAGKLSENKPDVGTDWHKQ